MDVTQLKYLLETILNKWRDPVARQRAALQRAEQRGMARMMEPLRRALLEADALGIQFYGERLEQYKRVLHTVSSASDTLPPLNSAPSSTVSDPTEVLPLSAPASRVSPGTPTYMVSSATLAQAYAHLTRCQNGESLAEWMLAVTGMRDGDLRTLDQLIDVQLANQSAVTAAFDMQDFARIAVTLHEHGQALHAIFHNHPFDGKPTPSAVDWRLQDLLDKGGYPAIQAVFSADGYVRFFARRPFILTVFGKGVERVDQDDFLYRLVQFGTLPYPGDITPRKQAKHAVRPVPAHPGR